MVLAVFASVFTMVLLAELADKTQLVTLALAAKSAKPRQVYLGAVAGLFCVTAIGAAAGSLIALLVPLELVRLGSGAAFLALGVYTIITTGGSEEEEASPMDEDRVWLSYSSSWQSWGIRPSWWLYWPPHRRDWS